MRKTVGVKAKKNKINAISDFNPLNQKNNLDWKKINLNLEFGKPNLNFKFFNSGSPRFNLEKYKTVFLAFVGQKIKPENAPETFVNGVLKKSAGIAAIAWFLAALFTQNIGLSLALGLLVGIMAFVFLLFEPMRKRKLRSEQIQADLPFVLMAISVELALNWPFEKILLHAGQSGFGKASEMFAKAYREIHEKGASVHEALHAAADTLESGDSKRGLLQVLLAYEQGPGQNRGENVRRIAKELLAKQRIASKAFSGKIALFSLVFIAVSAIVPAIFQAIVIVGSSFLDFSITPLQALLIIAVGFPLLDLAVLLMLRSKTPVFLKNGGNQ